MEQLWQERSMQAAVAPVPSSKCWAGSASAAGLGPAHLAGCDSVGLVRHLRLHPHPQQRVRASWDDDQNFLETPISVVWAQPR